jgi:glycine C-acetyltransferase
VRTQMSAAHSRAQLERAVDAFVAVGRQINLIS